MMINFNVFSSDKLNRIVGYTDTQLVVIVEFHRTFLTFSKTTKKKFYPEKLT